MTHYLLAIDAGIGTLAYELRESDEARDACVRQVLSVHPDWRVWPIRLPEQAPEEGARVLTLWLDEAAVGGDPGRGQ